MNDNKCLYFCIGHFRPVDVYPWLREIGILPPRAGIPRPARTRGQTNRAESRRNRSTCAKHRKRLSNPRNPGFGSYGMCYSSRATRDWASNSLERPNRKAALAYLRSFWYFWKRFAPIWQIHRQMLG